MIAGTFGGFGKFLAKKPSFIDNSTFRLHYKMTFGLLLACSVFVTMGLFGAPVSCINDGVPGGIMNTYCWIHGTFTIPSQLTKRVGDEVPHPGVAPLRNVVHEKGHVRFTEEGDEIRHAWYQWVALVLFAQAILCYIPHYLWKIWEGGKLNMMIQGLDAKELLDTSPEKFEDKRASIANYFKRTFNSHNSYVFKFVFCEVLNLVNILGQIYFMDFFFNGQFSRYGAQVLRISEQPLEERTDPMNRVFPKVTKCTFHQYGPSGTVENKDGLCVLAINIINEKIYVLLWFWFIFVSVWTACHLMLRIVSIASGYCRFMLLCNRSKANNRNDISAILKKCEYGDWFLLMQMSRHINPAIFHDLVLDIRDRVDTKRAANVSNSE